MSNNRIEPPWITYPGYPPGDGFWRQSGEAWFTLIWEPFWNSLDSAEQRQYLQGYVVPESWQAHYFDPEFRRWLDTVDDE